ncbi:hypothetical protein V6Z12_A10G188000 [Gossypium hirsutum]
MLPLCTCVQSETNLQILELVTLEEHPFIKFKENPPCEIG